MRWGGSTVTSSASVARANVPLVTLDDIADIADVLNSVGADSLGGTAGEVEAAALTHGVSVVPATIDLAGITLDSKLGAADVVALAARSGAKLIYLARAVTDTSPIVATIGDKNGSSDADTDMKMLLCALRQVDGFTSSIEVGFAHGGIVHTWKRTTTWVDELEELQDSIDSADEGPEGPVTDDEADQRLAADLAADPAFRRARGDRDHQAAALLLPAIAQLADSESWRLGHVIRLAYGVHNQQREVLDGDLTARISELVPLLASSSDFRSARTADGRRKVTEKWIAENYSDGLRMGRTLIGEFAAAAKAYPSDQLGLI